MILFVPSTGFQSSATFPIAFPGGSRTSRISGSEIIIRRYTGPIGLKHFASELSNPGRTEVFPALRQERFPPGFRHQHVPASRGDFADDREPSTISQGRFRIPLEHRLNRIGTNRRDEFVVASVVQDELLRDRGRERREARVPRERPSSIWYESFVIAANWPRLA